MFKKHFFSFHSFNVVAFFFLFFLDKKKKEKKSRQKRLDPFSAMLLCSPFVLL